MNDLSGGRWRKSSYSGNTGNCVEVRTTAPTGTVAVRDSKRIPGPELSIPAHRWSAFVRGVKRGRFDPARAADRSAVPSDPGRLRERVDEATARLTATAAGLTDSDVREPALLPGWSRGPVPTHTARNADGLRNLLAWARPGGAAGDVRAARPTSATGHARG
jgi:hypothetical protein